MAEEYDEAYVIAKNDVVTRAFSFAAEAHKSEFRKGSEIPYILHPAEVAAIVGGMCMETVLKKYDLGDADSIIAAAVLHDTVEDTPVTKEDVEKEFGADIAMLVSAESENKRGNVNKGATWKTRKQETIDHLKETADIRVKMIAFADKLSNLRAIARDKKNCGSALWNRFNVKDPAMHGWYYRSIFEACTELTGTEAYREYEWLLSGDVFRD